MPHECTTCGRQFDDGSKEMLSGCPNCGGNKFQFQPAGRDDDGPAAGVENEAPVADAENETAERAADAADVGDAVEPATEDAFDDAEIADEVGAESGDEVDRARQNTAQENTAQAESTADSGGRGTPQGPKTETPARDSSDEFDFSGAVGPEDDDPVEKQPVAGAAPEREEPAADEDADLGALREELNDQFESIKITAPGQYELNLMELYDRKEYIISLREDGRYVIEMSENYGIDD